MLDIFKRTTSVLFLRYIGFLRLELSAKDSWTCVCRKKLFWNKFSKLFDIKFLNLELFRHLLQNGYMKDVFVKKLFVDSPHVHHVNAFVVAT